MSNQLSAGMRRGVRWGLTAALLLAAGGAVSPVRAQSLPPPALPAAPPMPAPGAPPATAELPRVDPLLRQTGCKGCESGLFGMAAGHGGCSSCGSGCLPGRQPCCCPFDDGNWCGRMLNGLCECFCCPDPCYLPEWTPLADSAFFVDAARPITHMKLRWDNGWNFPSPDRAEYFWARQRAGATGKGPAGPVRHIDYEQFSFYQEVAAGRFGAFIEVPYREWNASNDGPHDSGFVDLNFGTKSLLLDCPLMQIAFQFKVFVPSGVASKGLGTSHTALEPSLLWAIKLAQGTYVQAQTSYWIPIAGDAEYAGDIFHYHLSLNQLIWEPCPRIQIIGTLECNGWAILDGSFTDPNFVDAGGTPIPQSARGHLFSAGPGLRVFICEKIDLGVGSAFAVTSNRWADELIRAEFRWRF